MKFAKAFGDESKPKAWSKYSKESSAYQKKLQKIQLEKSKNQEKKKLDKVIVIIKLKSEDILIKYKAINNLKYMYT